MIRALIILLVYVIGPLAILAWAVHRYRHGIRPALREWIIVSASILLLVLLAVGLTWQSTDRDAAELKRILDDAAQRYDFPVQARFQERPALEGYVRPTRLEIHVYGVVDAAEQDKLVFIFTRLREQYASKPVVIHFLREEIWEEAPDGSRQPRRDREELMRKVRID
jgi:hypothetical protein